MKTKRRVVILLAAAGLLTAAAALAQIGGGFDLTFGATDASSASSGAGVYELFSTAGQPAVRISAPSTGGTFSLQSGFQSAPIAIPPTPTDDFMVVR